MSASTEDPRRYRCGACGNLTRFDVVTEQRTRAFHHFTVGGALEVEDVEVLDERVVEVACRWCGHGRDVQSIDPDTLDAESLEAGSVDAPSGG